jgi:fatty acid desaturase
MIGHLTALVISGAAFWFCTLERRWIPACIALLWHGMVFSFLGYAGACHELSHGTVFRSRRLNQFWLNLLSFLVWTNQSWFVRSHRLHHRHTLQSGLDCEVPTTHCLTARQLLLRGVLDPRRLWRTVRTQWLNARGVFPRVACSHVLPEHDLAGRLEVQSTARVILGGHAALLAVFLLTGAWQLVLLISLASFIGNGPSILLASAQHCGRSTATLDFRDNSRTVLLPAWLSFFYWNMNYHVEHHMYPGVPCYRLPALRTLLADDLPAATVGVTGVLEEFRRDQTRSC